MSSTECSVPDGDAAPEASSDAAHWPAVASLTLGVFGLVTAEFLPASLLTAMAADLRISEGAAGQTVTATALIGAIAAPSIPVLTRRMDRRRVRSIFERRFSAEVMAQRYTDLYLRLLRSGDASQLLTA